MKAAVFSPSPYQGPAKRGVWPVPADSFSAEQAEKSMETHLEMFEMADELGFDWVTVAEHHFAPMSMTPNPMVMAGALSQRVKRAKIALLGPDIPILNPIRVAEEFAMLDAISGGRVVAGMMRGTSNEYVTYNVNPSESRARFEESLQLIVKAWTEPQPFGWEGRYYQYRAVSIWPRPIQKPYPPIYMSGSSPEAGEMAARNHVRLGFAVTTVPLAARAAKYYREQCTVNGWECTPEDILYRVGVHVADTDEQAFEDLSPAAGTARAQGFSRSNPALDEAASRAGYYGRDTNTQRARLLAGDHSLRERVEAGQTLCGSPESVLKQLQRVRDEVGAGVVDLIFAGGTPDKTRRSMELFGTQVLPRMHEIE